jgi:hypothetical protein
LGLVSQVGLQAGDRGGDLPGPGPTPGGAEPQASAAADEAPRDREDPQPQPFGFPPVTMVDQEEVWYAVVMGLV